MNSLTISNISKHYGDNMALCDVSLKLTPGIYGLLGPNGAGKSTLMQILTLSLKPDHGELLWNEKQIAQKINNTTTQAYFEKLAYVPQNLALYPDFTAWEFLDYIAVLKGISTLNIEEEIKGALEAVELWEHASLQIKSFSGGMKQRLMIAQSLMGQPAVLLLDEPTTGLDPRQRMIVKELLAKLREKTIILLSTHIVSDIEALADQVILINKGEIVKMNSPKRLIQEMLEEKRIMAEEQENEILSDLEKVYLYYCKGASMNIGFEKNISL